MAQVENSTLLYEIRSAGLGKGMGVFALQYIKAGSTIVTSKASLKCTSYHDSKQQLGDQFRHLHESDREAVLQLSNCKSTTSQSQLLGIFQTNCSYIEYLDTYFLCVEFSRLNHSCNANCTHIFDRDHETKIVRATRDISRNEELTINYLNSPGHWFLNVFERQDELQYYYNFTCDCNRCQSDIENSLLSCANTEANFSQQFYRLNSKVHPFEKQEFLLLALLNLLPRTNYSLTVKEYCHRALFLLYCQTLEASKAKIQAEKCHTIWTILHGENSFQARRFQFLAKYPMQLFGEVEREYGASELTEHDELILCGMITAKYQDSDVCRNCSKEVSKAYKCHHCILTVYCSSDCLTAHQWRHEAYCKQAVCFGKRS